ncbi:MAG TPA: S8 family serine peptidase [Gaiellaceae bacterium]|nr:S8 family serine peptidase [Gaiellaceae bacterium]
MKARGALAAVLAICALTAVLAATAAPAKAASATAAKASFGGPRHTWIDPKLISQAKSKPGNLVDVIITSTGGTNSANAAVRLAGFLAGGQRNLNVVGGVELKLPARFVTFLQKIPGLTVTPNVPVKMADAAEAGDTSGVSGADSNQLWPFATGNAALWADDLSTYASSTPAIAVIDSGVQSNELGSRVIASVNVSSDPNNTTLDDQAGHGTFVADIAAGQSDTLTGADPAAPIVSVKVMGADGSAKVSDVIAACQWVLDHKDQYNIRVANFSMHSSYGTNSYNDPLDQAVEKLWFAGVTVVAAAGNYGTGATPSGVLFSPGNDPFVVTVGAAGLNGTASSSDDNIADWSAWGYTEDGFAKPEIVAPGRYMVSNVPSGSTLTTEFPQKIQGTDGSSTLMQISGTSFAAPVVSGTAAEILARHPGYTPDQVKGELMKSARSVPNAANGQAGVGEITAPWAANDTDAPNPNAGLDQFVGPDSTGATVFDADAWKAAVQSNAAWNDAAWNDAAWNDAAWNDAAWNDAAWNDAAWNDAAWNDAAWNDAAWNDAAWNDAAWNDAAWNDAAWNDAAWNDYNAQDAAREDAAWNE